MRLEPDDGKPSSPVLRGRSASNGTLLPDIFVVCESQNYRFRAVCLPLIFEGFSRVPNKKSAQANLAGADFLFKDVLKFSDSRA